MSWLSSAFKSVVKETNRFLDKRVGIDDPGIRKGIIIGGSVLAGGAAGAAVGGAIGGAAGGALATGGGAVGTTLGAQAGIGAGTTIGGIIGGVAGAGMAGSALAETQAGEFTAETPQPFAIPTNFPLAAARGRLSSSLAKQRKRAQTQFTGGLEGGKGFAPSLFTI